MAAPQTKNIVSCSFAPDDSSVTQNTEVEQSFPHFHYHSRYALALFLVTVLVIACNTGSTVVKGCSHNPEYTPVNARKKYVLFSNTVKLPTNCKVATNFGRFV
jgi:hypothetical protein